MSESHNGECRLSLDEFAQALADPSTRPDDSWHAVLVDAGAVTHGATLREVCAAHGIRVVDTIDKQLAELARTRHPAPDGVAARASFVEQRLPVRGSHDTYGYWAWFPWMFAIVHVLPPEEYFDVITNRNQDTVTRDEQLVLRRKRIGVVGLSVGGEAAITVAQEHLCGYPQLASEARFAAGQLGFVARRLLLGDVLPPSWQHIDLDELLMVEAR